MKLNKIKLNKMTYVGGGLALALVAILGSTYAYRDFSQHKTNEFNGGTSITHDATLIEDFVPKANWKFDAVIPANNKVKKEVSVKNTGKDSLYVRVKFQEFMEKSSLTVTTTPAKYMVKTNGDFVTFTTQALANAAYPGYIVAELTNVAEAVPTAKWYIESKAGDINGQYGRTVNVIANGSGPLTMNSVIAGSIKAQGNPAGEALYPVHGFRAATSPTALITADIALNLGTVANPVQLMSTWTGTAGNFWVLDDTNDDGWMYWGNKLTTGQTTHLALNTVELKQAINGTFYYALHTKMDALSHDEAALWAAPAKVNTMINATK